MRQSNVWLALSSIALLAVTVGVVGLVFADEVAGKPPMVPQKAIAQPLLDGLVGSWTTESTGVHEGKEHRGTGKASYAKAIGGTALVQTYESTGTGPDGKPTTYHGHGVYKVSDDGKSATLWWFCNMSPTEIKLTGSLTESGLDLSGDSPHGTRVTASLKKTADGLVFRLTEGENEMTETYRRAK